MTTPTPGAAMAYHQLADEIDAFILAHAKERPDFEPGEDPESERYTSPDASEMLHTAACLRVGKVTRPWSSWASGGYRGGDEARAEHDRILAAVRDLD